MFLERFFRYLQFEKRFSPHTLTSYKNDIGQFAEYLSGYELDYASAKHSVVRSWMVEMMDGGTEPKTIARKLSALRSFYKFLLREGLVEHNPMLQVKAPKIPKKLPVVVSEEKLNVLLDSDMVFPEGFSGLRDRLVMELLFSTGMRLAELVALKDSDIDFYSQSLKVLGKRNKERIIPISTSLLNLTKLYISEKKRQNFDNISTSLIVKNNGMDAYPKLIYRIVNKYLSEISTHTKKSPHILRHTFATSLLNNGADINAIKELLGHASLAATQVYTHNSVERLKSIYKQAHPKA
ncbi:MAG: tyrosine-type recombinase/integrase [Sphingobacteriaceae bacterium]|jgi:integrase/recombinase XerC|nr:tyrosine-type recombinase/integrase [Sphingobacteriaceae bacterium]